MLFRQLLATFCLSAALAVASRLPDLPTTNISLEDRGHYSSVARRDLPKGQCDKDNKCWDSSCCSKSGWCGRDPDYCSTPNNCISDCTAKSECGRGAEVPGTECQLKVCCGPFGYCGTTSEFCVTSGAKTCQSNCEQPGSTGNSGGNIRSLVIGYLGAWQITRRGCAQRSISDIPIGSLTHLNVAFAYIAPTTYSLYVMNPIADDTFAQIVNLKQQAPNLKMFWIALGGWTYSDNDTTTQGVWGDLSSTPAKRQKFIGELIKFMDFFGFDGVDLDWEYPGAPDRGGTKKDGDNFAFLLADIRTAFNARPGWGISFTAPTSYWYLRWFPVEKMYQHVDWINLMSYDLHGSWDDAESWIGSYVYGHTNLTEIDDALKLMWRNSVPANKINLGIGFYGRSYQLSDPNCAEPGCAFKNPGRAGSCTGEGGVLSFDEIESMKKIYGYKPVYDKAAGVKYFAFNEDQWVSYDDAETLQLKVDFAQKQGLLGLFIWAVDLDTRNHDALRALLGGKLNIFAEQNGVKNVTDDWQSVSGTECVWSDCDSSLCSGGYRSAGARQWCKKDASTASTQLLCCPIKNTPDPNTCSWEAGNWPGSGICLGSCPKGKIPVVTSTYPMMKEPGKDVETVNACLISGKALYCCDERSSSSLACTYYPDLCVGINRDGAPVSGSGCPNPNQKLVTYARGDCSANKGLWSPFCCDSDVVTDACHWSKGNVVLRCEGAGKCNGEGEVTVISGVEDGAGYTCQYPSNPGSTGPGFQTWPYADVSYCCPASILGRGTVNLPVPLSYLFPDVGDVDDVQRLGVEIKNNGNNQKPNDNAFGFFIISGPKSEVNSMNAKRDGAHWELFNCPKGDSEERHTVQAVCTVDGPGSTCDEIFEGGAQYTVVEMPDGCGPGRYAMVVDLTPSPANHSLPHHLFKRLGSNRLIYDFTFDYDFAAVKKRADSTAQLRIDYSDDPGYWAQVVNRPGNKASRRRQEREVQEEHGGDHKQWLEHSWHKEKRSMPMEELHKRWFSGNVLEWFELQAEISLQQSLLSRRLDESITWVIIDQVVDCGAFGFDKMQFKAYADLELHAEVASGFTAIGRLADLRSFDQSHVWFRSKGRVDASLHFDAFARMAFTSGKVELFGLQSFGSPFRVPGLVTVGPNFKVIAELSGEATFQFKSNYKLDVISWDYSQRYPAAGPESNKDSLEPVSEPPTPGFTGPKLSPFEWDINANGEINVHVIPQFTLGISFDSDSIASAEIILGADNHLRAYGNMNVGSSTTFKVCYGSEASILLYAEIKAPTLFGINLGGQRPLKYFGPFEVYPYSCQGGNKKVRMVGSVWEDVPSSIGQMGNMASFLEK